MVLKLFISLIMIYMGYHYEDSCPNGAAGWLRSAGIIICINAVLHLWSELYKVWANRDGNVDLIEGCIMCLDKMIIGVIIVVEVIIIIWGLATILPAWANLSNDPTSDDYCQSRPFYTALGVLFFKVVLIPIWICLGCYCKMCCPCCTE